MDPCRVYLSVGAVNCTDSFAHAAIDAGANGFRLIAKGAPPGVVAEIYRQVCEWVDDSALVILDLPGSKPRLTSAVPSSAIEPGTAVIFTLGEAADTEGAPTWGPSSAAIFVGTRDLDRYQADIKPGDRVVVKVGEATFEVLESSPQRVIARCVNNRPVAIAPNRSILLPDSSIDYSQPSDADMELLTLLPPWEVSLALSMVASAEDVRRIGNAAPKARIIPKVESRSCVRHLDEVIRSSSLGAGVMLARGDLSFALTPSEMIDVTRAIGPLCATHSRRLFLATWILHSMAGRDTPSPDALADILYFYDSGCRDYVISGEPASENALGTVQWLRTIVDRLAAA